MATKKKPKVPPMPDQNGKPPELTAKLLKFHITTVFVVEEDGKTVGEMGTEPDILYNLDQLQDFIDQFEMKLAATVADMNMRRAQM